MSVVTAVKYLAAFATEALRPWDPSRELASRLLADLPLMQKLRADDEATADEVTFLVLDRFAPAEPPSVPGKDHLSPRRWRDPSGCFWVEHERKPGHVLYEDRTEHADNLGIPVAYAIDVYGLVEARPDAEAVAGLVSNACTCGHPEDEHITGVCTGELTHPEYRPCDAYMRAVA